MEIAEAGQSNAVYGTINDVGMVIALLFGLFHSLKLKNGWWATFLTIAVYYFFAGRIASAIIYIEDGFRVSGRANAVYAFAYMPLLGFLVALIARKNYKAIWDALMVIPLTMFACARVACTVAGCCRGFPTQWGVYNPVVEQPLFPVQLLETLISLAILAFVLWREKKNAFVPDGKNMPIILISYGIARFLTEFLHDDAKIFGFTWMQVHCVVMIAVGILTLKVIQHSEKNAERQAS